MLGLIYMYKNKLNGMAYVGQTICSFEHRLSAHLASTDMACSYIDRALHKYGKENFEFIVLENNIPNDLLDEKEIYYIKKYDTFNNGYNLTLGGQGALKYDDAIVDSIDDYLITTNIPMYRIAEMVGVSYDFVVGVNSGESRFRANIDYPIRKDVCTKKFGEDDLQAVLHLLKNTEYSMTKIADITNTNFNFVCDINRGKRKSIRSENIKFPVRERKSTKVNMTLELAMTIVDALKNSDKCVDRIGNDLGVPGYTVGCVNRGKHTICDKLNETFPIRKTPHRNKESAMNLLRKLSDSDLYEIIDSLINSSTSLEELANRYGVSRASIARINEGKTFKNITSKYKLPIRQNKKHNKDVRL